jgi:hypothetical protein
MLPFVIRGRNEAAVYFEQVLDLGETLTFIESRAAAGEKVTLFQIILAAMLRTLVERPELNRFVAGGRVRQRSKVELSFAIKRAMRDDAPLTTTKVAFDGVEPLGLVGERMYVPVRDGKAGKKTTSDVEMEWFGLLPVVALRLVMWAQRWLDAMGLLPAGMARSDPLYASVFFANLGSVGLDSAYHHLFEYGTCPLFAVVGKVKKAVVVGDDGTPVVRDVVSIKYSFDERIADGLYCARSLETFRKYVETPSLLTEASRA